MTIDPRRIVHEANGGITMHKEPQDTALRMADGKMRHVRNDAAAAFSANGRTKPEPSEVGPRNAVLTRSECAAVLGVDIEQAARLLDQHEIPRQVGYDGPTVRALRDALTAPKRGTLDIRTGGLDPVPDQ